MDYHTAVKTVTESDGSAISCTSCGVQAAQTDVHFCRACGAELKPAVGHKAWSTGLLTRSSNLSAGKPRSGDGGRFRKYPVNNVALGLGLAAIPFIVWGVLTEHGSSHFWGLVTAFSFTALSVGIGTTVLRWPHLWGKSHPALMRHKANSTTRRIVEGVKTLASLPEQMNSEVAPAVTTTELVEVQKGETTQRLQDGA